MTDYEDYRQRIIDAQTQWNQERSAIYIASMLVGSGFEGDLEPPTIPGPDNYDTMTLAQMVEAVEKMNPALVQAAGKTWFKISSELQDAAEAFNSEFRKTVEGDGGTRAWGGVAADQAVASVQRYTGQTEVLGTAAHLVGLKLNEMETGLNQTKALMPLVSERPDLRGKTLPAEGIMKEGDYTEEEAENEGRRVLRTVYSQVAHQSDHGVPVLPSAPVVVDDGGPGPAQTTGRPSTAGQQDDPGSNPQQPQQGETPQDPGEQPQGTPNENTTAASTTPQTAPTPTDPGRTTISAPTNTPSTTPGTPYVPTTTGNPNTLGRPSSPGTPGSPGRPSTPGAPGTPTGPAPGRSIPGTPQTPQQNGVAPAAAARANGVPAGRAGMPGMPMGMAPSVGRGQDEERNGQSAIKEYLITKEHGEELTGLDRIPKTVPPVLGDDDR
ncbi:hypothetical protein [Nocardia donostiensis]|uniref:PPE family domain-containing protein n=1 Tax=Nocardia donostiensis TaxID=1538463 RepID=A0A1V2THF3_9NOCA|nr:hypothetical protein [Nocardia donostiensis]ONM48888.1 hypothetical protein B0T46_10490 [Nocardia donostiensis]OQS22857.1 hypothetical protein B0T44_03975 [Nocardia donostiensis]